MTTVDQALLTIGGQILLAIDSPRTISALLDEVREWRAAHGITAALPFGWFTLALDTLYILGLVELHDQTIHRTPHA